jgi:hypothetical protein
VLAAVVGVSYSNHCSSLPNCLAVLQTTPLVAGVGIATAALLGREVVKQYIRFKAAPAAARAFYKVNCMQLWAVHMLLAEISWNPLVSSSCLHAISMWQNLQASG